jgi:acyl-[acyl-carrier-protein]-phospholipid O-acyltransferase/long-chain-fatty-acid--[acyl-carrier-protein] ligase
LGAAAATQSTAQLAQQSRVILYDLEMGLGLKTRGFRQYLGTQFLGAFNDNAFRFTVIFCIQAVAVSEAEEGTWLLLAQVLFALPFIVLAALAGSLADRVSKSTVIRWAKVGEIVVMLAAVAAFASGQMAMLLLVLLLMSTQSAFFGPAKYGYLAEMIDEQDLTRANGLVQLTTMIAIVAGQTAGGFIYDAHHEALSVGALWFVGIALVGTVAALGVPLVAAARPDQRLVRNPLPDLAETWRFVLADRTLLYTMLGNTHFYMLVACLQINLTDYAIQGLELTSRAGAASLVATATLGIGLGSVLAGRWSERRVELGLVPLGALTMSLGLLGLAIVEVVPLPLPANWATWIADWAAEGSGTLEGAAAFPAALHHLFVRGLWAPFSACLIMGMAGGLYIVPLWALLQQTAPKGQKGRFLAFGNMVGFVGIALSGPLLWYPRVLEMTFRQQFLVISALALGGTIVSLRLLPYAFLRFIAWLLAHSLYRISVLNEERLPAKGGALLLVNHVSWVDALILQATTRRGMHFLMYRAYYEWWPVHWLFKLAGCIPVASGDDPALTRESLRRAGEFLDQGKLVVIFGEGAVTQLGHMLPFRTGYRRVIEGREAPIIPVHLGGLWGSILSHEGGRLLFKIPSIKPYPVTVNYGDALPPSSPPHVVRHAIRGLSVKTWAARRDDWEPLHVTLLREGRRRRRTYVHEGKTRLSVARLLARSVLLGRRLSRRLGAHGTVGVVGSPGLNGLVTQLALLFSGRVPCLLSSNTDAADARRAGLIEEHIEVGADVTEDACVAAETPSVMTYSALAGRISSLTERMLVLLFALLPARLVLAIAHSGRPAQRDDPVAVLLQGTDVLRPSHVQVRAKVEGLRQVMGLKSDDGLLAMLPGSRCHGLVMAQWLPLLSGLTLAWPDPAESAQGRAAGKLVERLHLTLLPATPSTLETLLDQSRPDTLGGLRLVTCGDGSPDAARVSAFADAFGIRPMQLLSLEQTTSVVSMNIPDVRREGVFQKGNRDGSVGHPLPGVAVEIVDPTTGAEQPPGVPGRLFVRGPSVIAESDDSDRGFDTGLTASIDEEGFISVEPTPESSEEQSAEEAALPG